MEQYPSSLPCPLYEGRGIEKQNNLITTEFGNGNIRVRKIGESKTFTHNMLFRFTKSEVQTFEYFYNTTLQGGIKPFQMSIFSQNGKQIKRFRFLEVYTAPIALSNEIFEIKIKLLEF